MAQVLSRAVVLDETAKSIDKTLSGLMTDGTGQNIVTKLEGIRTAFLKGADGYAEDAEAWAKGTRNQLPVAETDETYHNNSKYYSEQSSNSADASKVSEDNAKTSESNAKTSADNSERSALRSEAWADGTKNGEVIDNADPAYNNNAKYYSHLASTNGEAWSRGTRDGIDVLPTDEEYHNNAKYYSEVSYENAEAWARGTRGGIDVDPTAEEYENNAKYYSNLSRLNAEAWSVGTRDGVPISADDPAYDNNAKYWSDKSGSSRLSSMDDVNFNGIVDGQIIKFDGATNSWRNYRIYVENKRLYL